MKRICIATTAFIGCMATAAAAVPPTEDHQHSPAPSTSVDTEPLRTESLQLEVRPAPKAATKKDTRSDEPGTPHRPADHSGVGVMIVHYEKNGKPARTACTATNISLGGKNVILTARHCLPGYKGLPKSFYGWFMPGANHLVGMDRKRNPNLWVDEAPFGVFPLKSAASFTNYERPVKSHWTDVFTNRLAKMLEKDLALLTVGTNEQGQEVYDVTGDVDVDLAEYDRSENAFSQGYPDGWLKRCDMAVTERRLVDNLHTTPDCKIAAGGMSGTSVMTREGLHFENDIMTNARSYGVISSLLKSGVAITRLDKKRFWALLDGLEIENRWPENSSPDKVGFTPIPSSAGKLSKIKDCPLMPYGRMMHLLGVNREKYMSYNGYSWLGRSMGVTGRNFGCSVSVTNPKVIEHASLKHASVTILHLDPQHRGVDLMGHIQSGIDYLNTHAPGEQWFAVQAISDLSEGVSQGVRVMSGGQNGHVVDLSTSIYYRRGDEVFLAQSSYDSRGGGTHHEAVVKDIVDQAVRSSRVLAPRP